MSPREGIYYAFMIGGCIAGVAFGRAMGWPHIVGLIIGLGVGVASGFVGERLFSNMQGGKQSPRDTGDGFGDAQRAVCPSKSCGWTGDAGSRFCPRCGEPLAQK